MGKIGWVKRNRVTFFSKILRRFLKKRTLKEGVKNKALLVFDLDGVLRRYSQDKKSLLYVSSFLWQIRMFFFLGLVSRTSKESFNQFIQGLGRRSPFHVV